MKKANAWLAGVLVATLFAGHSKAQEELGYRLTTDVVYGEAQVEQDGQVVSRDLMMDVYEPTTDRGTEPRPAVILVHGGAWHRGGRRYPPFEHMGGVHSMMEGYARLLTPLGYSCFVIEYRLVPDNPVPVTAVDASGLQPYQAILTDAGIERLTLVRNEMGLAPLTKDDSLVLWKGVLAGAEDVSQAIAHVRSSAEKYGVDPNRLAVGGHSAGAANTLNAVFGMKAEVAALFPLSPGVIGYEMSRVIDSRDLPPMLLMASQNDLGVTMEGLPGLLEAARNAGAPHEFAWVPGFGHFYPTEAVSLGSDGRRMAVGARVVEFLAEHLD